MYRILELNPYLMDFKGDIDLRMHLYHSTKHRILGAIIAYFIMTFLLQIAAYVGMIPMYSKMFVAEYTGESINMFDLMHPTVMVTLIASVIIAVIMYFINIHMMTKRLNLE